MNNYDVIAKELRGRARRLLQAADAMTEINHDPSVPVKGKRRLSAAARKRIAVAQKLRWAKVRKQQALSSKR